MSLSACMGIKPTIAADLHSQPPTAHPLLTVGRSSSHASPWLWCRTRKAVCAGCSCSGSLLLGTGKLTVPDGGSQTPRLPGCQTPRLPGCRCVLLLLLLLPLLLLLLLTPPSLTTTAQ